MGSDNSCKGICHQYKAVNKGKKNWYGSEFCYCSVCSTRMKYDGLYCPCCGYRVRKITREANFRKRRLAVVHRY